MYKVGVMMMGKQSTQSPAKVKEVILQVQAKTKILNIFEYLLQLQKIKDMKVSVSLQKGGASINQTSTISQVLKYTRPVNGVIKLFCYEDDNENKANTSVQKLNLKMSRHQIANKEHLKKKQSIDVKTKDKQPEEKKSGICCC